MQHYQFHIGDYRSATMHLSDDEDLAYRRLIDHYYDTECQIDLDTVKVARKIRCKRSVVDQVLAEFFTRTGEGFKHFRCEEVIGKFYEKSEVGRKYAQARWDRVRSEKASTTQSEPNGYPMATHKEASANPMLPVTRNPIRKPKVKDIAPKKFDPVSFLKTHGVSETVAKDWLTIRKTKKAPPTETSLSTIVREAEKAGISMQDAITRCCQNSWAGFKASWPEEKTNGAQHMNVGDRRAETIAGLTGRNIKPKEQDHERDITGDCKRIA